MSDQTAPDVASTILKTVYGEFDFHCFSWGSHEEDNILCLSKSIDDCDTTPLCRLQSACYTAEIFRSLDCDCHAQLESSLSMIQAEGGLLIYILCDGRGAGLYRKTLGLELGRTEGLDTADAYTRLGLPHDLREYSRPAQVLQHLGIDSVRLLTNNPRKVEGLRLSGIAAERKSLEIRATSDSEAYLRTKALKMGHLLSEFQSDE